MRVNQSISQSESQREGIWSPRVLRFMSWSPEPNYFTASFKPLISFVVHWVLFFFSCVRAKSHCFDCLSIVFFNKPCEVCQTVQGCSQRDWLIDVIVILKVTQRHQFFI